MKICLLILYTEGWMPIAKVVLPVATQYCKKHGYDFKFICFPGEYPSNFGFNKIRYIQEVFKGDCDICWSLDLDTMITNHNIRVEDFLQDGKDFYITKDVNAHNAGSFIVKKSEWSKQFLEYLLQQKGKDGMHCEQNAIDKYIEENGTDDICVLPHPSINSYHYELYPEFKNITHEQGNWEDGDFVLHLPGVGMDKRLEILKNTPVIL